MFHYSFFILSVAYYHNVVLQEKFNGHFLKEEKEEGKKQLVKSN